MHRRVQQARVARLATIDEDGGPNLVPITFAMLGDVLYSAVDHKPKTTARLKRLENIERDPRVTVLVDHYDEDWTVLWWVRLQGSAELIREGEIFESAVDQLARKYRQYRGALPVGPVIAIDVTGWTGWAASAENRQRKENGE